MLTGGWQRGEEFVILFSRINQGKSQVLIKMATSAWLEGNNVGFISPEMSANSIGFRFDTMTGNFSNSALMKGVNLKGYEEYINGLKESDNKIIVATIKDFDRKVTVSKLKNFVKKNSLDMLCIDGISYIQDERYRRGDSATTSLTNISEDLMELSNDLGIPVIVVAQANRKGEDSEGDGKDHLTLGTIGDSDGIGRIATRVISLRRCGPAIEIAVKKNRYGEVNTKVVYKWDIDHGIFFNIPSLDQTQVESKPIDKSMPTTEQLTAVF